MRKRLTVYYSGSVQGVGFRFAAEKLSRHFDVAGYVRNLDDGKVEMVAEGEEQNVRDFQKAVSDRMQHYIRDSQTQWSEAQDRYRSFGIAF